jgi:hypothetical protein
LSLSTLPGNLAIFAPFFPIFGQKCPHFGQCARVFPTPKTQIKGNPGRARWKPGNSHIGMVVAELNTCAAVCKEQSANNSFNLTRSLQLFVPWLQKECHEKLEKSNCKKAGIHAG